MTYRPNDHAKIDGIKTRIELLIRELFGGTHVSEPESKLLRAIDTAAASVHLVLDPEYFTREVLEPVTAEEITSGQMIDYVPLDYPCSLAGEYEIDSPVVTRLVEWVRERGYNLSREEAQEFLRLAAIPAESMR